MQNLRITLFLDLFGLIMESKDVKQVESNSALNRLDRKRQSTVHQNSHGLPFTKRAAGSGGLSSLISSSSHDAHISTITDKSAYTCSICLRMFREPYSTICGHTFCHSCLLSSLEISKKCPTCAQTLATEDSKDKIPLLIPNFAASRLAECMRHNEHISKIVESSQNHSFPCDTGPLIRTIMDAQLSAESLNLLISTLCRKREELETGENKKMGILLSMFIDEMIDRKEKEMRNMEDQLELLRADRMAVSSLRGSTARYAHTVPEFVFSSFLHQGTSSSTSLLTGIDSDMDPMLRMKNRVLKHFDSLQDSYSAIRMKHKSSDVQVTPNDDQTNSVDGDFLLSVEDRLGVFGEVVRGVARYGQVHRVATLNYDVELAPQMSIVSSLEFDKDGELFVVAGVTKRIKIFDYDSVVDNPKGIHYPLGQLKCNSKISNVSWNPYQKSSLCSSDYEGHVSVWDVHSAKTVRNYQEHEKRVWTVHFNNVDPHLIASGSDDAKVKLWSMNCDRSVMTIDAKVNVCCVYFSPSSRHHLVYGSADHCVHLYDIRNTSKAVNIFRGHRKAVSYVRFINEDEVVSASTDSNLRVWCARTGRCTRVMRGHVNEKNFVGLSGGGDHVVCGSENNRAYFYYKGIGEPMVTYDVGMELGKESNEAEVSDGFVSSVCWKKNSDNVLVANSQGKVHVLRVS